MVPWHRAQGMPESRTIMGEPHFWQNDASASGWGEPQWGQNLAFVVMVSFQLLSEWQSYAKPV